MRMVDISQEFRKSLYHHINVTGGFVFILSSARLIDENRSYKEFFLLRC